MDFSFATQILNAMIAFIIALSFHEAAHALVARLQGDRTAEHEGRLTLNPMAHIDPVGTILFPIMGMVSGAPIIGWAKPVPVDPRRLKYPKWGYVAVSFAGPAMNILLCFLSILVLVLFAEDLQNMGRWGAPFVRLAQQLVMVNAGLAAFNLIPLPPLDGGSLVLALLPEHAREWYEATLAPYAFLILLGLSLAGALAWVGWVAQAIKVGCLQLVSALV